MTNPTNHNQQPTGVFSTTISHHQHWTYRCADCGYQSPFFTPTEEDSSAAYDSHRTTCRRTPAA